MNMAITAPCVVTGKAYTVFVRPEDYNDWANKKKLAHEAFPYLGKEDREFIISGISPDGWDEMFSDDASDES